MFCVIACIVTGSVCLALGALAASFYWKIMPQIPKK